MKQDFRILLLALAFGAMRVLNNAKIKRGEYVPWHERHLLTTVILSLTTAWVVLGGALGLLDWSNGDIHHPVTWWAAFTTVGLPFYAVWLFIQTNPVGLVLITSFWVWRYVRAEQVWGPWATERTLQASGIIDSVIERPAIERPHSAVAAWWKENW